MIEVPKCYTTTRIATVEGTIYEEVQSTEKAKKPLKNEWENRWGSGILNVELFSKHNIVLLLINDNRAIIFFFYKKKRPTLRVHVKSKVKESVKKATERIRIE